MVTEIRRLGVNRLASLEPPRPVVRYECERPSERVHLNIKKLDKIGRVGHRIHGNRRTRVPGIGWEYTHVAVDDHSRLSYAEVLADETAETTAGFLRRAVAWFAAQGLTVERLLTDNGPAYRSLHFAPNRRYDLAIEAPRGRPLEGQTSWPRLSSRWGSLHGSVQFQSALTHRPLVSRAGGVECTTRPPALAECCRDSDQSRWGATEATAVPRAPGACARRGEASSDPPQATRSDAPMR